MRQGRLVGLVALCALATACGSSSGSAEQPPTTGVLTGAVVSKGASSGTRPEGNIQVLKSGEIVASQHVGGREGRSFRFRLPAGRYTISGSVGQLPAGSCTGKATVVVGTTTHADATCATADVAVPTS